MKYFELFHFHSKKRKTSGKDPHDTSEWPKAWKTVFYKSYPRFEKLHLPKPAPIGMSLSDAIMKRHSGRKYTGALSADELSTILFFSSGEHTQGRSAGRRVYASGGGRYPIETYILVLKKVGSFQPGLYHYDVREHALVHMGAPVLTQEGLGTLFVYPESLQASCVFIYTAIFSRQVDKYGNRGYRHTLMEVGGISEHVGIVAASLQVPQCPMSGFLDEALEAYLDIDGISESVVHTIVVG